MRRLLAMGKLETPEETIDKVFQKFAEADDRQTKWTNLDTNMENLEWLDDEQLVKEATVAFGTLIKGKPRCNYDHKDGDCFVPTILSAVSYIIEDYDFNKIADLPNERQYVLRYFLSLEAIGEIFSEV